MSKRKPTICEDTGEIAKTYGDYLKTKHWRTFRKQILIDRKYTCEKCKRDLTHNSSLLHVHHTTYTNIGHENKEDVLLLCKDCHRDIHSIINSKKTKNKAKKVKNFVKRNKNVEKHKKSELFLMNDDEKYSLSACKKIMALLNQKQRKQVIDFILANIFVEELKGAN